MRLGYITLIHGSKDRTEPDINGTVSASSTAQWSGTRRLTDINLLGSGGTVDARRSDAVGSLKPRSGDEPSAPRARYRSGSRGSCRFKSCLLNQ